MASCQFWRAVTPTSLNLGDSPWQQGRISLVNTLLPFPILLCWVQKLLKPLCRNSAAPQTQGGCRFFVISALVALKSLKTGPVTLWQRPDQPWEGNNHIICSALVRFEAKDVTSALKWRGRGRGNDLTQMQQRVQRGWSHWGQAQLLWELPFPGISEGIIDIPNQPLFSLIPPVHCLLTQSDQGPAFPVQSPFGSRTPSVPPRLSPCCFSFMPPLLPSPTCQLLLHLLVFCLSMVQDLSLGNNLAHDWLLG